MVWNVFEVFISKLPNKSVKNIFLFVDGIGVKVVGKRFVGAFFMEKGIVVDASKGQVVEVLGFGAITSTKFFHVVAALEGGFCCWGGIGAPAL